MTKQLTKTALALALGLCSFAAPAYCSTIVTFSIGSAPLGSTTTGAATAGNFSFGSVTETRSSDFASRTFIITGNFLTGAFTANSLTLQTGGSAPTGAFTNLGTNVQLLTATTNIGITPDHAQPNSTDTINSGSTNLNALFASDLGLSATDVFAITGFFKNTTGGGNTLNSDTLTLTTANNFVTPEPGTLMLFSSALLGIAGFARRRKLSRS